MPRFLPSLTAALAWGAMFPIAGPALERIDAFHLTSVRYLAASAVFLALLAAFEGRRALRHGGPHARAVGTGHRRLRGLQPAHLRGAGPHPAAGRRADRRHLAGDHGARRRGRSARAARAARNWRSPALAFLGVAVVISHGDPAQLGGSSGAVGAARPGRRDRLDRLHARGRAALPRRSRRCATRRSPRRSARSRSSPSPRSWCWPARVDSPCGRRLRRRVVAPALRRRAGRRDRRARLERRREAHRRRQRLALHQPRAGRDVRDRDRARATGPGAAELAGAAAHRRARSWRANLVGAAARRLRRARGRRAPRGPRRGRRSP